MFEFWFLSGEGVIVAWFGFWWNEWEVLMDMSIPQDL
jgi:hypothetical protein